MANWIVRKNCEYSLLVEADTEKEAIDKAELEPDTQWDHAWSVIDAEEW